MMTSEHMPNSAVPAASPSPPPSRLLILGCSKAKTAQDGLVPAIERYDGPPFRVLRRYLRQRHDPALRVYILSAEFGLIPHNHPTPFYDRSMTNARAQALQPQIDSVLGRLQTHSTSEVVDPATLLVVAGKPYLSALATSASTDAGVPQPCIALGSQGRKLAALHDWLYGAYPETRRAQQNPGRPIPFRGIDVTLRRRDVLDLGRGDLPAHATNLTAWAVVIDGHRVAPKWLVSRATEMPVSRFTTRDALLLLARLGIEVERA